MGSPVDRDLLSFSLLTRRVYLFSSSIGVIAKMPSYNDVVSDANMAANLPFFFSFFK